MKKRVGIVGFRGYSGEELVRILSRHNGVEVYLMDHRSDAAAKPLPIGAKSPARIAATAEAVIGHATVAAGEPKVGTFEVRLVHAGITDPLHDGGPALFIQGLDGLSSM